MSKKLFVGNLPFSTTSEKLKELFGSYGSVTEAMVITNKFTGKSKGFGFVTLAEDAGAEKAISEMNGKDVEGRQIVVNEAKSMDPNGPPRRSGGFNRGRGGFGGDRRFGRRDDE